MKISRRKILKMLSASCGMTVLPSLTAASSPVDGYPSQPVSVIVPYGAGGSADSVARLLVANINSRHSGKFIVENKPGAAGNIGTTQVARSNADGRTLLYTTATPFVINPYIYKKLPFDPTNDFIPIARTVELSLVLVVGSTLGIKNFNDLKNYLKQNPKTASYSSYGGGSSSHIASAIFAQKLGMPDILHVPYKDSKVMIDLVSGRNTFHMDAWSSVSSLVKAGQLVAIAVSSLQPTAWAPELPTIASQIGKDYEIGTWHAIFAPAKTPKNVVDFIHEEVKTSMASADIRRSLTELGYNAYPYATPEQVSAFIKSDRARWQGFIKDAGVKAE